MKRIGRFRDMLASSLSIPEERQSSLPSGFQRIGSIAILNLKPDAMEHSREIANLILKRFRYIKTVCLRSGPVSGELRKPSLSVIAGEDTTLTLHRENNCLFRVDVAKVMFSKGNLHERARIPRLVKDGETVADLFAGIGYFSIPVAKLSNPSRVYAIEKNPESFSLLKENIKLNKLRNIIPIKGDNREVSLENVADRVIMGYLPGTEEYLGSAMKVLKPEGGTIHYHNTYHRSEIQKLPVRELKESASIHGYTLLRSSLRIVKEYAPGIYHVVMDAVLRPKLGASSSD